MRQPTLFEPAQHAPAFIPQTDDDGREWGDFDSCLEAFGTNACTLDGQPARIIGTPRSAAYAHIEPIDLGVEPIRCCWDVVDMVMSDGGAFSRADDDTDD
jgi:hypothetical protein